MKVQLNIIVLYVALGLFSLVLAAPDFSLDREYIETSLLLSRLDTSDTSMIAGLNLECLRNEGCINGGGIRTLLRFGTKIDNIGDSAYVAGRPPKQRIDQGPWTYDTCHDHWHFKGYASYALTQNNVEYAHNNAPVRTVHGRKNGFCLMDTLPSDGRYCNKQFDCCNQGVSPACSDIYSNSLDCQWIDITGVDLSGEGYNLEIEVNPGGENRVIKEEWNYWNNKVSIPVDLRSIYWIPLDRIEEAPDAGTNCSDVLRQVAAGNPRLRDRGQYDYSCKSLWLYVEDIRDSDGKQMFAQAVDMKRQNLGNELEFSIRPNSHQSYAFAKLTSGPKCMSVGSFTHLGLRLTAPRDSDMRIVLQASTHEWGCSDSDPISYEYNIKVKDFVVPDGKYQSLYVPLDRFEKAAGGQPLKFIRAISFELFSHPGEHYVIEDIHFRRVCSPRSSSSAQTSTR